MDRCTHHSVDAAESTSAQIFGQLLETVRGYDDNRADRRFWSGTGVHMIQWFALQAMAFFTFCAVAFIDANSGRFELMLCLVSAPTPADTPCCFENLSDASSSLRLPCLGLL